ncbi:glycosyltransferase family 4 protein [Cohnella zeiphila]|uniref:Glycosyltransferase family 4 protein n=1 Tax=Cohnella zeiphila TaxID=2761120 RepID=A0A7X0VYL0_9BACL|nr:glycosyltransferase family 4 protein [Cohnella zeiphila]MBB6733058.1 glycosyltransferase family 4 protein [Cohnella zeiphila]
MNGPKTAYVATVYSHLANFHIPFMKMLQSRGCEVHAYASPDHCKHEVEGAAIPCRDISFSRSPLSLDNAKALRELTRWLRREKYDIVHVHTPNASVVCRIAARLAGCPLVVYTAHGFHFYRGAPRLNWLLYYSMERILSRWTDVLITINGEDYRRARTFPVRGRVAYIPGVGVDAGKFGASGAGRSDALRAELGADEMTFVVLCVAELNDNKNQRQLILAIQELARRGVPAIAVLAGVGEREAELRSLAKECRVEERVRFAGFRRDIPELMRAADAVVLLSKREGLPKAVLEAMAAGKPIVVTDVRGSRDLVASGENGFVVPVGDAAATADALGRLCADPAMRKEFGAQSLSRAERYDIERIKGLLMEAYSGKTLPPELADSKSSERVGVYEQTLSVK